MAKYGVWRFVTLSENDEVSRFEVVSTSGKSAKVLAVEQYGGGIMSMKKICNLNGYNFQKVTDALRAVCSPEDASRVVQLLDLCGLFDEPDSHAIED